MAGGRPDTDHDSLTDYLEVTGWARWVQYYEPTGEFSEAIFTFTSDPHKPDSDGDGLADADEAWTYFGNPLSNDTDNDDLVDPDERDAGTGLNWADSDGDLLPNGREVHGWSLTVRSRQSDGTYSTYTLPITTDPLNATDTDGDEVADIEEYRSGGHPYMVDTDNDGLTDREEHAVTHTSLNLAFHTTTQTTGQLYLNHTHVDSLWTSEVAVKDQFGDSVLPFTRTATGLEQTPLRVKIWDAKDWNFTSNSPKSYRFHIPPLPPIVIVLPPIATVAIDELSRAVAELDAYYDKLVFKFLGGNLGYSSSVVVVEPGYQVDRLLQHRDIPGVNAFTALENQLFDAYLNQWTTGTWGAAWGYWGSERKFTWGPSNEYSVEVRWNDPTPSNPYHVPSTIRAWDYDDSSTDRSFKIIQKSGSSTTEWSAATLRQFLEIWIGLKLRPIYTDRTAGTLGELRQHTTTLIRDWYNTLSYTEADFVHAQSTATVYDLMQVTMARVRTLLPNATLPGITLVAPPAAAPPPEKKNWWEKTWDVAFDAVGDLVDIATDFLGTIMEAAMDLADAIIETAAEGIASVAEFAMDIWEWVWAEASPVVDKAIKTVENVVQSVANFAIEKIVQLLLEPLQDISIDSGLPPELILPTDECNAIVATIPALLANASIFVEDQIPGVTLPINTQDAFGKVSSIVGEVSSFLGGDLLKQLVDLVGPDIILTIIEMMLDFVITTYLESYLDNISSDFPTMETLFEQFFGLSLPEMENRLALLQAPVVSETSDQDVFSIHADKSTTFALFDLLSLVKWDNFTQQQLLHLLATLGIDGFFNATIIVSWTIADTLIGVFGPIGPQTDQGKNTAWAYSLKAIGTIMNALAYRLKANWPVDDASKNHARAMVQCGRMVASIWTALFSIVYAIAYAELDPLDGKFDPQDLEGSFYFSSMLLEIIIAALPNVLLFFADLGRLINPNWEMWKILRGAAGYVGGVFGAMNVLVDSINLLKAIEYNDPGRAFSTTLFFLARVVNSLIWTVASFDLIKSFLLPKWKKRGGYASAFASLFEILSNLVMIRTVE